MPLRLRLLSARSPGGGTDLAHAHIAGPTEERAIELADDTNEVREIRIGRRPDLELPLPYPALSGLHARLLRADGRWQIEDLGSTNGTRVDGERLTPHQPRPIAPGAQIKLGQITLVFDGTVGEIAGAERTATIARRLVSDLFSASSDMATPSLSIVGGVPARPPLRLEAADRRYVAGRGETCDLQLASEEISREHVEIFRRWDGVVVNDLGSKNGLRVNDVLVLERCRLRDGDLIQIGPATLRLSDPADRYLREFEARAPQVPRTENEEDEEDEEDENVPAPETASPAGSAAIAEQANSKEAEVAMVATAAAPAPAGAVAPTTAAATGASRRAGSSRTPMVVAAVVLIAVGAVIVALVFGG
jgi:pSer/pThr/pTyr-binding forkhead associated (FHA) protein